MGPNYKSCLPISLSLLLIVLSGIILSCSPSPDLVWNENEEEGYRWAEISPGLFGRTGFKALSSSRTGITFVNRITDEEIDENRHYLNGSGVAAGDINGNGFVDLYFTGLHGSNRLYKNLGGMRFEDITEQAGVAHEGYASTGAVFADVNGNGHLDLLVTSLYGENVLYMNDGEGNFERRENSGLGTAFGSNTMALADITGNGYPDLYITNYKEKSVKDIYTTEELDWRNILAEPLNQPTDPYTLVPPFGEHYELVRHEGALAGISEVGRVDELYLNRSGTFEKVAYTEEVFLDEDGNPFGLQPDWGLTAKFQDLTGNGLPDLYVCNDFHTPDRIWINQGDGSFRTIGWEAIRNLSYSCMGVDFSDINRNGRPDIFTTEMLDTDHSRRLRQAPSEDHVPIGIGQIDSRPMYNRNSLFVQREDGTFAETSWLSGVEATGWSWATRFMDIDLDGYEDLIVTTGYLYDILDIDAQFAMIRNRRNMDEHFMEFIRLTEPLELQNRILRNNGDLTFTDVSTGWGFTDPDISHGMAFADLNNNGVLDVIVNRMNLEAVIYENRTKAPRIAVRLKGAPPNTQAIGAKVELTGGPVYQQKEITVGGDYASGSDPLVVFAADQNNPGHLIHITWPDGTRSRIEGVKANRIYEVEQGAIGILQTSGDVESPEASLPLFEDATSLLNHTHHEDPFDDFRIQPLLPFRLSQPGPGVAWIDLTGNGFDELLIASGKGGELAIRQITGDSSSGERPRQAKRSHLQESEAERRSLKSDENEAYHFDFTTIELFPLTDPAPGDQTAIIGWRENDHVRVVVGSSNYEQGSSGVPSAFVYAIGPEVGVEQEEENGPGIRQATLSGLTRFYIESDTIPGVHSATGPLAAADVTGNGYPDLFVGGRFKPGQYPIDADSRFFINDGEAFRPDPVNSRTFTGLGLVTGAVFADFTQNGRPDLLVSAEWGSLRLFENREGVFEEITEEAGLARYKGWWNGVASGDFTNNGLPDIVATNIGLNSPYQIRYGHPLRIYYGDLDGVGSMDILEAYADENGSYLPRQRLYKFQEQQIVLNRMGSHREFAVATLNEILGERYNRASYKEINTLEHMLFINTGNGFEARPLPAEAQRSMAFHAGVADFDNDGNEDIFLTQNFFAVSEGVHRMDAGRGLLLKGDGNGNFSPVPGSESGIKVYGEQRGAAFSDVTRDGRMDLVASQNGAETKLFLNRTEKAGYRITLEGPPPNRSGIGSAIRLVYENGEKGPRREVQSGSGFLSQNSPVQIMGAAEAVKEIEIHWFDGTRQVVPVTEGEMEVVVIYPRE